MKYILCLLAVSLVVGCSVQPKEQKTELELGQEAFERAKNTVIPLLSFTDAPAREVANFIVEQIKKKYPDFQYVILFDPSIPEQKVSLTLRDIPAYDALKIMSSLTHNWQFWFSGPILKVSNNYATEEAYRYDAYHFPKELLFDTESGKEEFIDAKPILEKMGIRFPEGSQAIYRRSREILTVKNTQDQLDLISRIVEVSRKR